MVLADDFDSANFIKFDLLMQTGFTIPLCMLTDSLALFGSRTKSASFTEKKLKIYLKTLQKIYNKIYVREVVQIRYEYNIGNALTMVKRNSALMDFLETTFLAHPFQQ